MGDLAGYRGFAAGVAFFTAMDILEVMGVWGPIDLDPVIPYEEEEDEEDEEDDTDS